MWMRSRTARVCIVAICIVLAVVYFKASVLLFPYPAEVSFATRSCQVTSSAEPFVPSNKTWRDLPKKYPPKNLVQFSNSRPRAFPKIQYTFNVPTKGALAQQRERRDAVKATFMRNWNSYKEKAWMKDEVSPISGSSNDKYGGWATTLVDNLDTLWIMDLGAEFKEATDAAIKIDFSDPDKLTKDTISVFETTIRFVGGFLAAFELTDCKDLRLLDKAAELGDMLYVAFDNPNRMPTNTWSPKIALNFPEREQRPGSDDNIFAHLASLSMEFTRLSQLTGDARYFDAIQRITQVLHGQQASTKLPGMWPQRYDVENYDFRHGHKFTLGAEAHSGYEYLLKMVLLSGTESTSQYESMYKFAMDTAIDHLFFRPMVPDNSDILLSGKAIVHADGHTSLIPESEHLSCFVGGMLAMGGRIFQNETHLDTGRKLTEGCAWGYRTSPAGILPENYQTISCLSRSHCKWDVMKARGVEFRRGFTAACDPQYRLRPEAIESIFYLYRTTGDTKYQDIAWEMFQTIERQTATEFGNAELTNVMIDSPRKKDAMESFWMAQTLKYFYLIFSSPELISLDDFVLNTEAHPFRIPKP